MPCRLPTGSAPHQPNTCDGRPAGRAAERARVVQERAAAAAPKVLVVVVFVLVPAALLPVLAAVALSVSGALMHL